MILRHLKREEIEAIWTIDRREVHHHIYTLQGGKLTRTPAYFEVPGWAPGQVENDTSLLYACFDRGGAFLGMFQENQLVGVAVVDTIPIGSQCDHLQLKYLYVSRDFRGQGVGTRLFEEAEAFARSRGARFLYISATPTENTVDFYLRRGCCLANTPDPELFALEPEDIHLVCAL
jgi:GNAT superfamily N-acetyltransferase